MDLKTAKKKLFHIAQLYEEMSRLVRQLDECMKFQSGNEFVDNILSSCNWEARKIHYGCRAEKDALYSSDGELLSKSSGFLSNPTSYYQVRRKTPAFRHGDIRRNRNSERRPSCESDKDLSV